jgi:hypothetical protein
MLLNVLLTSATNINTVEGGCHDRMIVGYLTTYAISAYHHYRCEFESSSGEVYSIQHYFIKFVSDLRQVGGFLYTTLCDKVCKRLATGRWFSPVFSTNKTDHQAITEILLNTIYLPCLYFYMIHECFVIVFYLKETSMPQYSSKVLLIKRTTL